MRHDGQPLSSWFDAAYWRALNPSCTVSAHNSETAVAAAAAAAAAAGGGGSCSGAAAAAVATTSGLRFPPAVLAQFQERIDVDGYVDLNADLVAAHCPQYPALIGRLRGAVEQLVAVGWPATFIVVYNEAWELVRACTPQPCYFLLAHLCVLVYVYDGFPADRVRWMPGALLRAVSTPPNVLHVIDRPPPPHTPFFTVYAYVYIYIHMYCTIVYHCKGRDTF